MKLSSIKDPKVKARALKLFVRLRSQRDLVTELDSYHTEREAEERRRLEQTLFELSATKTQRMSRIVESQARYRKDLEAVLQITEEDAVTFDLDKEEVDGYRIGIYEERIDAKKHNTDQH